MGCTEAEWLGWLPAAIGDHPYEQMSGAVAVSINRGSLSITWRVGEPRAIALARIPRLIVQFAFEGLASQERLAFMRRFDLYTQRGGG